MQQLMAEAYRLRLIRELEESLRQLGFERVAGVDEAGRGCLAGPVVAAAVIPDPRRPIPGVDDSKRLPPEARARLAERIRATAVAWRVVAVTAAAIDRTDILRATKRAMAEALTALDPAPDCAVIDAVPLPDLGFPCLPVVRGDRLSYAVAAASILAKDGRDRMMAELDADYPHYGFVRHKGYAAPEHLAALEEYGPSPCHRLTFRSVLPRAAEA